LATKVVETESIELISGKKIGLRPLKISLLREFMSKFDGISEVAADNTKSMDLLLDCVQIAMKQYAPDLADDRELLEDELDLPNVYKVIEVAAGIKFDDPNLMMAGQSGRI
jgi:hypothetical protein